MSDDSATQIFSSTDLAQNIAAKVVTIHRPGYEGSGKPSLITGEPLFTDKQMRDLAVQSYKVLDRAFRLCLATRYRMIQPCDADSDLVTAAIERFMVEASK